MALQPSHLVIQEVDGRKRLAFTNDVGNQGVGVLERFPAAGNAAKCGQTLNGGEWVFQRIYQSTDGYDYYTRSTDTSYRDRIAGCMTYHPAHHHWPFEGFTLFQLMDGAKTIVRGMKTSTCMMDSHHVFNLPGAPSSLYYR